MQVAVERRPTLLFIVVLALLFLLMSASGQTKTRVVGQTRTMFERTVMTVFSPVPKFVNYVGQQMSDAYHGYIDMRRAIAENLTLNDKVAQLARENLVLRQTHGDLGRLRSIVAYTEQFAIPTVLAQVVMLDASSHFKSLIIDRGSDRGVELNDAIVSPSGLVGRVVLTTKDLAKVELVIDSNSAVGALLGRTRRQGILRGDGRGGLQLLNVPSLTDVVAGDTVLTAGIDGIYPREIPVATVVKVEEGDDLFKKIYCRPTVELGTLEEVIVLKTRKIPPAVVRYAP